jgi:predicted metal-binding protein
MTTIFVCTTCREPHLREQRIGPPCGERMEELVREKAAGLPDLKVVGVACLMGCEHGCNVSLSNPGKMSYVLGRFTPDEEAAGAIVDYARKHAESESGVVAYREWPQGVKGHFIARIPPLPE